jgi:MoaA/NifB/PqqE/SkfB family radical SAM enzyme
MNKLDRIFNLLRIYINYCFKRIDCSYYPIRIWIELSSRCNLRCRFCVNKTLPSDQKGDMDFQLFKKIIDEIAGKVHDVNLFHRGEPLLNNDLIPMIAYAAKNGVKTRIHTNATLMNKKLDKNIILSGLDLVSFSFDGYTRETYEKNRIGAGFDESLANIIDFLKVKKQLKSKKPYTIIQVITNGVELSGKNTIKQKKAFLENFKNLPLDKVVTRSAHNWGGLLKTNGADNNTARNKKINSCTFPWYSLTIFYDGRVFVCPQDFEGKIYVGDINESRIEEIFNGVTIRSIRKAFKSGIIDDRFPCRNCDRIRRKYFLGIPVEYLRIFIGDHLRN